jgi:hypothetical protein
MVLPELRSVFGIGVELGLALLAAACTSAPSGESGVARERGGVSVGPPLISMDFALGAPVLAARSDVFITAVAAGPDGYLVLSERNVGIAHHELLGTRILDDGTITDPQGVLIATTEVAATSGGGAAAQWAGDGFLVAYGNSVWTVGADGKAGTSAPLGLVGYLAGMSWDGERALVTTTAGNGVFVSAAGSVMGSPFTIHPLGAEGAAPVFDGTNFLVSYLTNNPSTVHVTSVGASGPTGKTATLYAPGRPSAWVATTALAAGGGSALAHFYASPPSCALGGRCTPLEPYYQILTSAGDGSIALGAAPAVTMESSITYGSGNYVLYSSANVVSVTTSGVPTGPAQPLLASVSAAYWEAAATTTFKLTPSLGGSGFLSWQVAWAGRVGPDFALRDDPLLAPISLPLTQSTPVATFDGTSYVTAWNDSGRGGIAAARVSTAGVTLDDPPRMVAAGVFDEPFAASNGESSVVGWGTSDAIGLAQLTKDLSVTPLDLSPLSAPYVTSAALASDGADYLLGFSIPVVAADPPAVRASLVSELGAVAGRIDLDAQGARVAAVHDGENYVLTWMVSDGGTIELRAARITPSLVAVDAPHRVLVDFPGTDFDLVPRITSNGSQSFVTWTQSSDGTIRAARVSRELELLDAGGVVVANDAASTRDIVTAWDGTRYWIVWQGERGADARHVKVFGRRFTPEAVALDDAPFLVTEDVVDRAVVPNRAIGLAADHAGGVLFTYEQDDVASHGFRVRGRMLGTAPDGEGGSGGAANGGTGGVVIGGPGGEGGTSGDSGGEHQGGAGGEPPSGAAGEHQRGGGGGTAAGRGGSGGTVGGGGHGGVSARGGGAQAGEAGEGGGAPSAGHGGSSAGRGGRGSSGNAGAGHAGAGTAGNGDGDSGCNCSVPSRSSGFGLAWVIALGVGFLSRRRAGVTLPGRGRTACRCGLHSIQATDECPRRRAQKAQDRHDENAALLTP